VKMFKFSTALGLSLLLLLSSSTFVFAQGEDDFVRESVISKRDAVVLSSLFPGLGQMTQGHKVKGVTFFLSEAVSLIIAINAHENYGTKKSLYNRDFDIYQSLPKAGYLNNGDYSYAKSLYDDLKEKESTLNDLNTIRNSAAIVAVGIYAFNVFDMIFLTSSTTESNRAEKKTEKIEITSSLIETSPGIVFTKRF